MMIEIELYDGNRVFIAHDGSSGCDYSYNSKEELASIVSDYIMNMEEE